VGDAKRAVNAVAVMERRILSTHVLIVARVAHVVGAEAAEKSNGTAVHALPVDLNAAVRLTRSLTSTNLLKEAILAEEIFLLGLTLLCVGHLLLTVNETTEVGLLASVALVKGGAVVSELLRLSVVDITLSRESLVIEDSLVFRVLESLLLNILLQGNEGAELASDRLGYTLDVDLLLAAGAVHEGERNPE
jgi:hypothetical protein